MKTLLSIILVISLCLSFSVHALKIKPVTLQYLSEQAELVAIVEIESSKYIKSNNHSCGVEHQAVVIHQLKGDTTPLLKFGYMEGLKAGAQYLVFLDKDTSTIFTNTNFQQQLNDKARLNDCKTEQTAKLTLSQAGTAYFEITHNELLDGKQGIKIKHQYFKVTDDLKPVIDSSSSDYSWVDLDVILSVLKK